LDNAIYSVNSTKKRSKKLKKKVRSATELQLDKIDMEKVSSSQNWLKTGSECDLVSQAVKNTGGKRKRERERERETERERVIVISY
jgi:hypothetical protein